MDLPSYLEERRNLIDAELERILNLGSGDPGVLIRSMRYSVLAGGKRVRPILVLAACEAVGGAVDQALPVACAMELGHTFTLIHDDLPCMDDDDTRRGRPSNHKVFGEAQALLAGCSLLALAFEIIVHPATRGDIPPERAIRVAHLFARGIGWAGVMEGQSIDMESTGRTIDLDRVRKIARNKTATLIAASLACGAVMGGGTEKEIGDLESYGLAIGLAFQVTDDILNIEGNAARLGKKTGTDADAGKTTFPALLGANGAKEQAVTLLEEAMAHLVHFGGEADLLRAIARYIVARDH